MRFFFLLNILLFLPLHLASAKTETYWKLSIKQSGPELISLDEAPHRCRWVKIPQDDNAPARISCTVTQTINTPNEGTEYVRAPKSLAAYCRWAGFRLAVDKGTAFQVGHFIALGCKFDEKVATSEIVALDLHQSANR